MLDTSDDAVAERLTQAMEGVCTNTAMAEACGVSIQAVALWKKKGQISRAHLHTISTMIDRDVGWLLTGLDSRVSEPSAAYSVTMAEGSSGALEVAPPVDLVMTMPVVGTTQGGPDKNWIEEGFPAGFGDEYIDVPSKDPAGYGLRVRGLSMYPRMKEGEVVSVSPATEAMSGDEVIIRTVEGAVMVKELVYNRNGEVALDSVANGEPRIVLAHDDIVLMHTVTGVHRASSIKKR